MPGALVLTVTYLGSKGTRAEQMFLPNTYPDGARESVPGLSHRIFVCHFERKFHARGRAGSVAPPAAAAGLPRHCNTRIRNRSTTRLWAGGIRERPVIAQNWLDLSAERGLSNFDQRHLLNAQIQYTTGMGLGGGTLLNGWKAALFKEWTFGAQITAGTGLPLTPIFLAAVDGTGVTGSIRPDYTGAPLYAAPRGLTSESSRIYASSFWRMGQCG